MNQDSFPSPRQVAGRHALAAGLFGVATVAAVLLYSFLSFVTSYCGTTPRVSDASDLRNGTAIIAVGWITAALTSVFLTRRSVTHNRFGLGWRAVAGATLAYSAYMVAVVEPNYWCFG